MPWDSIVVFRLFRSQSRLIIEQYSIVVFRLFRSQLGNRRPGIAVRLRMRSVIFRLFLCQKQLVLLEKWKACSPLLSEVEQRSCAALRLIWTALSFGRRKGVRGKDGRGEYIILNTIPWVVRVSWVEFTSLILFDKWCFFKLS
jgi:hypothetical protein